MSQADDHYSHSGEDLPEAVVAGLRDRSQLDFDLEFFEQLLEREPEYVDVLRCQGELLSRKGRHDEALAIDRRLVALLPRDSVVQYNLACSLALLGERADAITALRRALECGYADLDFLKLDSDLDGVRDEPDYRALLAEFGIADFEVAELDAGELDAGDPPDNAPDEA